MSARKRRFTPAQRFREYLADCVVYVRPMKGVEVALLHLDIAHGVFGRDDQYYVVYKANGELENLGRNRDEVMNFAHQRNMQFARLQ